MGALHPSRIFRRGTHRPVAVGAAHLKLRRWHGWAAARVGSVLSWWSTAGCPPGGPPGAGPYGAGGYGSPPPPGAEGGGYHQPGEDPEQRKKSDKKKYLAAGAAGLALGAAGGAIIAHEMGMLAFAFASLLYWRRANWSQEKIVALPMTRRSVGVSVSAGNERERRRRRHIIQTAGMMTILQRMIGDLWNGWDLCHWSWRKKCTHLAIQRL